MGAKESVDCCRPLVVAIGYKSEANGKHAYCEGQYCVYNVRVIVIVRPMLRNNIHRRELVSGK